MGLSACVRACCWMCAVLVAATGSENPVYRKVGDTVVLSPSSVPAGISSIIWKYGSNLAMSWDDGKTEPYKFKERGSLDPSTGSMTITGLTLEDSYTYTVEISDNNYKIQVSQTYVLKVINPVPVPTVSQSCADGERSCTLTCDGNVTGAAEVTYEWMGDGNVIANSLEKQLLIKDNSSIRQFTCELKNPVSQEISQPINNPLNADATPDTLDPKVIKGIIVFACLLLVVLLPVVVHRCKTGVCFYEKESMPWERDFWSNEKTSAAPQNDRNEEETLQKNKSSTSDVEENIV